MDITINKKYYILKENVQHPNGETEVVSVNLIIDETNKSYEILPGDHQSEFSFKSRIKNAESYGLKWAAVAKLIYSAVSFANLELKVKSTESLES